MNNASKGLVDLARKDRPRVAWFSCLYQGSCSAATRTEGGVDAHAQSVSAYYSEQLLPILKEKYEIELFHDSFESYKDFPTFHYLTAAQRHKEKPFDLFFYQLEDGKAAAFCRMHMTLIPGISLFHNFLLVDDGPEPILNSPWTDVAKRFKQEQMPWPDRNKVFSKVGKAALREAAMCFVPVFASQKDYGDYLNQSKENIAPGKSAAAFFLWPPVSAQSAARHVSSNASADGNKRTILFCGSPRIEHRAHCLLAALGSLGNRFSLKWLLSEAELAQAKNLCEEFDVSDCEFVRGRSPENWAHLLEQGQIVIHTHFSVFGNLSPYLQMSLMAAKPCIVSDFGASDFLPSEAVFKLPLGHDEVPVLKHTLEYLSEHSELRTIEKAREFALEFFETKSVAYQLDYIFQQSLTLLSESMKKWNAFETDAQRTILDETRGRRAEGLNFIAAAEDEFLNRAFSDLGWLP